MKRQHSSDTSPEASSLNGQIEPSPLKKFKPNYSEDVISVLVGSAEEKFVIHKSVLCNHSGFFQAACGRECREGQEKVIRLPEADAEAFAVYAHWAYTETLNIMDLMPGPLLLGNKIRRSPAYSSLGKVWILANFLDDSTLANQVIDRLLQKIDKQGHIPNAKALERIWMNTPQGCGLQRVLLEMIVVRIAEQDFEENKHKCPQDLLFELAKRCISQQGRGKCPTFADRCNYHTHEQVETRCQ